MTKLLDIAIKEFASNGFGGTQQKIIAKKAGVANSLMNYHFNSKEDLWIKAATQLKDKLLSRLNVIMEKLSNPEEFTLEEKIELLKESTRQFIYFCAEHPEFDKIFYHEVSAQSERADWLIDNISLPINGIFQHYMTLLDETNLAIKDLPRINFFAILGGACSTFFIQSYQLKRLFSIDSFSQKEVENHANTVIEWLYRD